MKATTTQVTDISHGWRDKTKTQAPREVGTRVYVQTHIDEAGTLSYSVETVAIRAGEGYGASLSKKYPAKTVAAVEKLVTKRVTDAAKRTAREQGKRGGTKFAELTLPDISTMVPEAVPAPVAPTFERVGEVERVVGDFHTDYVVTYKASNALGEVTGTLTWTTHDGKLFDGGAQGAIDGQSPYQLGLVLGCDAQDVAKLASDRFQADARAKFEAEPPPAVQSFEVTNVEQRDWYFLVTLNGKYTVPVSTSGDYVERHKHGMERFGLQSLEQQGLRYDDRREVDRVSRTHIADMTGAKKPDLCFG